MRPIADVLPPGYQLDDYVIEGVLGRGGFGITYRARSASLGVTVAVKEYFPQSLATRTARVTLRPMNEGTAELFYSAKERFHREMQAQARFRHPNIVRVSRVFQANDTYYAVLDFEDGPSLKTWAAALGRRPTQREVDALLVPLLNALETIHAQGTIHRDIAPDNIIVRPDGSPVLIDFGAAKDLQQSTRASTQAIVKHGFSPLEQYTGNALEQGPWTDIYALGATLYAILMNQPPPEASERYTRDSVVSMNTLIGQGYRTGFLHGIDWALSLHHDARPRDVATWRQELLEGAEMTAPGSAVAGNPVSRDWVAPAGTMQGNHPGFAPSSGAVADGAATIYGGGNGPAYGGQGRPQQHGHVTAPAAATVLQSFGRADASPAPSAAVTQFGSAGDIGRPRRSMPVVAIMVAGLSLLLMISGVVLVAWPEARQWLATKLPPAMGCMLEASACGAQSEGPARPAGPGVGSPVSPASGTLQPRPPAVKPSVETPPSPAAAPAALPGTLPTQLVAAVAQFETCLATNACNQTMCSRALDSSLGGMDRAPANERLQKALGTAQEVCRTQREEGAFAELNACVNSQPCDFEAVCLPDFKGVLPGEPSASARKQLDAAKQKAVSACQKSR